ncbi:MAG: MFS family permease, partial [Gammaproteobacteria bacterium]
MTALNEPPECTATGAKIRPWSAFSYPDYRVLWGALVTVSLVSWMRILGTAQWLFDETESAALVGFIGVVQLVVQIPALLWGGALADRVDRKRLMTFANVMTAVTLLLLGVLNWHEVLTPL